MLEVSADSSERVKPATALESRAGVAWGRRGSEVMELESAAEEGGARWLKAMERSGSIRSKEEEAQGDETGEDGEEEAREDEEEDDGVRFESERSVG